MRLSSRFKLLFIILPGVIGLAVVAVFLGNLLTAAHVTRTIPVDGGQISTLGNIEIEFDRPMKHDSAQAAFKIEPELQGQFSWDDNKMSFTPQSPFQPGVTYRVSILQGAQSMDRRVVKKGITWTFTTRGLQIAYLSLIQNGESGDIWRIPAIGGQPVQITESEGKVRDFSISKDGEYLAYSIDNSQGGDDLWVTTREGSGGRRLVDCGAEQCMQPAWSIDGERIAYSRSTQGVAGNSSGTSRVWLVDVGSGQTVPLYEDTLIQGTNPSWSPDGKRVAVFDASASSIRILDLETNKEVLLPTGLGQDGGWSPDGQEMIYNDVQSAAGLPTVIVYLANLNNSQVNAILGQDMQGEDYSVAQWSPDGVWIAIGVGNTSGGGGKQIVIMKPDGSSPRKVTNDVTYAYSSYRWDPSGEELVFQSLQISQASNGPEIVIWQAASGDSQILVKDAALPEWMP
jgi:Tol biopolymer transport system component